MAAKALDKKMYGDWLTRVEAAEYLGVTAGTLAVWACTQRHGLKFYRVGGAVRYKRSDLNEWLESRAQGGVALAK